MNKFKEITNQELLEEIRRRMSQKEISEEGFIKLFFIDQDSQNKYAPNQKTAKRNWK